jgi:hypothetical protein
LPRSRGKRILTVLPAKVTVALGCNFCRSMVLEAGAAILDRIILVHDLTADEMAAYAVTVQVAASAARPAIWFVVLVGLAKTAGRAATARRAERIVKDERDAAA